MESFLTKFLTFIANIFGVIIDGLQGAVLKVMGLNGTKTFDLFFGIFTASLDFMELFQAIGLALVFLIFMFQLTKTFFGPLTAGSENPIYLSMKAVMYSFLVLISNSITGFMIEIGTIPYKLVMEVDNSAQNIDDGFVSIKEEGLGSFLMDPEGGIMQHAASIGKDIAITSVFGGTLIVFLGTSMAGIIAYSYIKLVLEIVERYVVLAIMVLFAPLCIATGVSKNTSQILSGWFKAFISQIILMSMSAFFLLMFTNGATQILANMGVTNFAHLSSDDVLMTEALRGLPGLFLGMLILFAWLRTGQRIDAHMSTIGMTAAQSGGGLGADLFAANRAMGGFALNAANAVGGTNHKSFTDVMSGEAKGAANRMKNAAAGVGSVLTGKKPKMNEDSIKNYLQGKGQRDYGMTNLEKAAVKSTLANGGGLGAEQISDAVKDRDNLGAHEAVGSGIQDLMGENIPEGFKATEGAVNGELGRMSASFENENGESFDAIFSKTPLGEGSMPITDSEGNTWYATAQGDGAAAFYSGNTNDVEEAEGADAVEAAGGEAEMVQADGTDAGPQGFEVAPDDMGSVVEGEDGVLEDAGEAGAVPVAEDIEGNMHDISDMVNEDGTVAEGATMGTLDADGNFVESEDGTGTHVQGEDGAVFALGENEAGEPTFAEAGQMIGGEGVGATAMATDVDGNLHDMSGQIDENGNFVGEGTMGTLDADGNFVESEDGTGTHMQAEDGSVFEMSADGESFADSGMYVPEESTTMTAEDLAGNTQDITGSVDENGVVQGQRFSQNADGTMTPDENGNIVQTENGSMFEVGADGRATTAQTSSAVTGHSKVAENGSQLAGARFDKASDGTMVASANGSYAKTKTGGFAPVDSSGRVNSFSPKATSSGGQYVGFKDSNGNTSYAQALTNSDGSVSTNADGSINLANGQTVSAGDYSRALGGASGSASLTDVSGDSFKLSSNSFDGSGNIKTYEPVVGSDGQFAFDPQTGKQQFQESSAGGFVQDADGNFREVGSSSVADSTLQAGSTMRNASGEQFTLGESSMATDGSGVQTYEPVRDTDGNIQTSGGEPQYRPAEGGSGSYVMDSQGNMQELAKAGGSGAFNLQDSVSAGGEYIKTAGEGTYQAPDGSNYAKMAPSTSIQTYEKTDQGFKPSANGDYVQSMDGGKPTFSRISDEGRAGNGAALRYSKTDDGGYVRDNNGSYVQTGGDSGSPQFSQVNPNTVSSNSGVQRFAYDSDSKSYVPDSKGDYAQVVKNNGDVGYSRIDRSSISDKGVATFDKGIKGGSYKMGISPAATKNIQPTFEASGHPNRGDYFNSGGRMYSLNAPGSLKEDGSVQRYSKAKDGGYYPDSKGSYVQGMAEGATTPTYRPIPNSGLERFDKQYRIGSTRVDASGNIAIGPKDKMVNNKDGTIDLKFADGRTARLSSTNMYKTVGAQDDPSYAGQVRFGNGSYHYQDTTPAYKSFGSHVGPNTPLTGKSLQDVKSSLHGDRSFSRRTTYGTGTYSPMKEHNFKASDIQSGRIATYVQEADGSKRVATEAEVKDASVKKFVQAKRGGGFVRGRGFGDNGKLKEAYTTESRIQSSRIGKDGNLYIYNQPSKDGTQEVYCGVSAKSGKVPKGEYETKTINNEKYYMVKGTINKSKGQNNFSVQTVDDNKGKVAFDLKKGIDVNKRAPVKYNSKVRDIVDD